MYCTVYFRAVWCILPLSDANQTGSENCNHETQTHKNSLCEVEHDASLYFGKLHWLFTCNTRTSMNRLHQILGKSLEDIYTWSLDVFSDQIAH